MELASGSRLKAFFIRAVLYALGLAIVLAALFGLLFTLAKPKLMALAKAEMQKYGVDVRSADMSLFGYIHLRDIAVPLHQGGRLRIEALSVRPPLYFWGRTWLGGSGTLYRLHLEKGDASVFIPELRFGGVALGEKDPHILSRSEQLLQRLRIRSASAAEIQLALNAKTAAQADKTAKLQTVLRGFSLSGLSGGKIAELAYSGMDSDASALSAGGFNTAKPAAGAAPAGITQSHLHSGSFRADNIEAASLYALVKSVIPRENAQDAEAQAQFPAGARALIGKIRLYDVNLSVDDEKFGAVHFAAAELGSGGFALKGKKSAADFIRQMPGAAAAAGGEQPEKKQIVLHNLRQLLADIASVDIEAQTVTAEVKPNTPDISDDAAALAAPVTSAPPAGGQAGDAPKSVRDILDEEQQQAEQSGESDSGGAADGQGESLKKELTGLPAHFKLELASFALKANHWEQAIPHDFYLKVKDLTYLPGKTHNAVLLALQAMGHKDLQFSLEGDMAWNPADSALDVRRLAFYGRDMGGFALTGKFLNIPASAFDGKPQAIEQTLNDAAIATLDIRVQDTGFIKKLLAWGTTQINISAQELETDLYDIAVKSPPLLLKNSKQAENFSNIFGSFVRDSGTIRISLAAPLPNGLKLSDIFASQEDLSVLLSKVRLTADRPAPAPLIE